MSKVVCLVVSSVCLMVCGCGIGDSDGDEWSLQPLDGTLLVLAEQYPPPYWEGEAGEIVRVGLRSEKIYGCMNYVVQSSLHRYGKYIDIDVDGIATPSICATALGPAVAVFDLDLAEGTYVMEISYRFPGFRIPLRDRYLLRLEEGMLHFEAVSTSFTAPASDFVILD